VSLKISPTKDVVAKTARCWVATQTIAPSLRFCPPYPKSGQTADIAGCPLCHSAWVERVALLLDVPHEPFGADLGAVNGRGSSYTPAVPNPRCFPNRASVAPSGTGATTSGARGGRRSTARRRRIGYGALYSGEGARRQSWQAENSVPTSTRKTVGCGPGGLVIRACDQRPLVGHA